MNKAKISPNNRSCLLFAAVIMLVSACDIVDNPKVDGPTTIEGGFDFPENTSTDRVVVIEDFTGIRCGNCPGAAVTANELKANNPGRVLLLGVHAGELAEPASTGSNFLTDFTTEVGDMFYGSQNAQPLGRVNREDSPDNYLGPNAWTSLAEQLISENEAPAVLQTKCVEDEIGEYQVFTEVKWLSQIDGTFSLLVLALENSVIDQQLNYAPPNGDPAYAQGIVDDFEHNHLLREAVNGALGLPIVENPDPQNAETGKQVVGYEFVPNANWNQDNMEVVSLLINTDTGVIINASQAELREE